MKSEFDRFIERVSRGPSEKAFQRCIWDFSDEATVARIRSRIGAMRCEAWTEATKDIRNLELRGFVRGLDAALSVMVNEAEYGRLEPNLKKVVDFYVKGAVGPNPKKPTKKGQEIYDDSH